MIRKAEFKDFHDLYGLCIDMHKESRFGDKPFHGDLIVRAVDHHYSSPECLLLVCEVNGTVVGFIAAEITTAMTVPGHYMAEERFMYISKPHRGGTKAYGLLKGFVSWAESRGVDEITAGDNMQSGTGLDGLYKRFGFKSIGQLYARAG